MNICRGCGGTGIDAGVSPRAAQMAQLPVLMRKATGLIDGGGTTNVFRGELKPVTAQARGRMMFQGPLMGLHEQIEFRKKQGYEVIDGSEPDLALACQWCNGHGTPDGQLTVHALEKLAGS